MKSILIMIAFSFICVMSSVSYGSTDVIKSPMVTVDTDVGHQAYVTDEVKASIEVTVNKQHSMFKKNIDFETYIEIPRTYQGYNFTYDYETNGLYLNWHYDDMKLLNMELYINSVKSGASAGGLPYNYSLYSCFV